MQYVRVAGRLPAATMSPKTLIREILVLESDRLCGAVISRTLRGTFPDARVHCKNDIATAAETLSRGDVDLFVVTIRGFDLDVLTLLGVWAEHQAERTRVLVITPNANSSAMAALRGLPISGVFDSSCRSMRDLEALCCAIANGQSVGVEYAYGSHAVVNAPDFFDNQFLALRSEMPKDRAMARHPAPSRARVVKKPPPKRR